MHTKKIITGIVVLGFAGFTFTKIDDKAAVEITQYKDGTYSSTGEYVSPAGAENIEITLVIKDNAFLSVTFTGKASNPASVKFQELFRTGFEQLVVGKPINSINLTVVNGSSLTPKGFMDALVKIKTEAKV